jgi:hypothetical protein
MIVRGQRVDGVIIWDWVCGCAGRPCPKLGGDQATRRTAIGPYSPPPPCIYVFPGDIPSAEAPLANAQPWRASNSSPPSTPRSGGARGGGAFRGLRARPKGLEPAHTNRHPTPNRPNFSRRFWSQVHVTPGYQKALACIMVRGDDGAVGRAAGSVRLPQDVNRISDDPAGRDPRDHRPGGQRHRQLVDQSRVRWPAHGGGG